ncbi:hypothetical protein F5Y05DRAFT_411361 [Hypoxylon sp. FL0543]|nr:hypothetical protein F5Y05DRAFT_411361 [Hypoxylon sp. FL0543]
MGKGTNSTTFNVLLQTGQISSQVWSIFWGRMWADDDTALDGTIVFGGYDQEKTMGGNYTQSLDFSEKTEYACIVPQDQLLLERPPEATENFDISGLGADLTILLSTGLEVRVPNNQYLVPYVDIDRNGSRIFDSSTRELLITQVPGHTNTLGRYFLTAAYLMVDIDAHSFTL